MLLTRHLQTFGKLFRRLVELSAPRVFAYPGSDALVLHYWGKGKAAELAQAVKKALDAQKAVK